MKEYFTTSYEQRKKDKLLELNELYSKLLSTYTSEVNASKKAVIANELYNYNKNIIADLNAYLDLIETQITILDDKKSELVELETVRVNRTNDPIDYTKDITELTNKNAKYKNVNFALFAIVVLLIILLAF